MPKPPDSRPDPGDFDGSRYPGENSGAGIVSGDHLSLIAAHYNLDPEKIDGWLIAESLTRLQEDRLDSQLKDYARKLATKAVIQKAYQLIGPIRPAKRQVSEVLREPYIGELDTEGTLENILGKEFPDPEDWITVRREQKRVRIVLMMDTSLSMSGKKLALAAVSAAVLSMKVPAKDFSLVAFESMAHTISHLDEHETTQSIVNKIFRQSARGYTNIEAALREGRRELERSPGKRKVGLLITDGIYTSGGNPIKEAARFPRLFVFLTEDHKMNPELCETMARLGHGRSIQVRGYEDLPGKMLEIANRILR